jgi:hypothetical protein
MYNHAKILIITSSFILCIHITHVCCILLIDCVCFVLGNVVLLRSSKISKTKPLRSPSFSLRISRASYLEHIAPIIIFSIYFVELELHDRKVYLHTYVRV